MNHTEAQTAAGRIRLEVAGGKNLEQGVTMNPYSIRDAREASSC